MSFSKRGKKIITSSRILGRDFHVDHFVPDRIPCFQVILFGGSGVGAEEYLKRAGSVVAVFNPYLDNVEKEWLDTPFCFTYLTAPPDIGFREMEADENMQMKWSAHISDEVLPELPDLPIYWIGYSGGLVLGWYGLEESHHCFGAGALGGDQLFSDLCCPPWWEEPLRLYYNFQDQVFPSNAAIIAGLEADEEVTCFRKQPGSHALGDYMKNESFSGLLRRAIKLVEKKGEI